MVRMASSWASVIEDNLKIGVSTTHSHRRSSAKDEEQDFNVPEPEPLSSSDSQSSVSMTSSDGETSSTGSPSEIRRSTSTHGHNRRVRVRSRPLSRPDQGSRGVREAVRQVRVNGGDKRSRNLRKLLTVVFSEQDAKAMLDAGLVLVCAQLISGCPAEMLGNLSNDFKLPVCDLDHVLCWEILSALAEYRECEEPFWEASIVPLALICVSGHRGDGNEADDAALHAQKLLSNLADLSEICQYVCLTNGVVETSLRITVDSKTPQNLRLVALRTLVNLFNDHDCAARLFASENMDFLAALGDLALKSQVEEVDFMGSDNPYEAQFLALAALKNAHAMLSALKQKQVSETLLAIAVAIVQGADKDLDKPASAAAAVKGNAELRRLALFFVRCLSKNSSTAHAVSKHRVLERCCMATLVLRSDSGSRDQMYALQVVSAIAEIMSRVRRTSTTYAELAEQVSESGVIKLCTNVAQVFGATGTFNANATDAAFAYESIRTLAQDTDQAHARQASLAALYYFAHQRCFAENMVADGSAAIVVGMCKDSLLSSNTITELDFDSILVLQGLSRHHSQRPWLANQRVGNICADILLMDPNVVLLGSQAALSALNHLAACRTNIQLLRDEYVSHALSKVMAGRARLHIRLTAFLARARIVAPLPCLLVI